MKKSIYLKSSFILKMSEYLKQQLKNNENAYKNIILSIYWKFNENIFLSQQE